jgi:hypothetical protein
VQVVSALFLAVTGRNGSNCAIYFGCFTSLNTEMIPENIFGMFFEVRLCLIDDAYIGFE